MKVLVAACLLIGLASGVPGQPAAADLVVLHARVRTMDPRVPRAEALAVRGDEIVAVGTSDEARRLVGSRTRVVDAAGRLVLPGFNDAHVHFMAIGNMFSSIDLRPARSVGGLRQKIAFYVRFLPRGRWILGGQWDNTRWDRTELPTRDAIDDLTPHHPVLLYSVDPSVALANGLALRLAGITAAARGPGGEVAVDDEGEPTGILRGSAIDRVRSVVPGGHTRVWPAVAEAASRYAASLGVTSVQDMDSDDHAAVYRELERRGHLRTRVYDCVGLGAVAAAEASPLHRSRVAVRQGCLKGFSDGDRGEQSRLTRQLAAAGRAELQVMVHAIGPEANDIALTAIEQGGGRRRVARPRIEHAHGLRQADIPRFARSGAIASVQPFLFAGSPMAAYRGMLDAGVRLALGSDAPMTDFNPLLGVYAAVTAGPGRAVSVHEAVYAYTMGSAFAEFQEDVKGSLEPGKLADFVILSDDIFSVSPERIREAAVVLTVMGGKVVYEGDDFH